MNDITPVYRFTFVYDNLKAGFQRISGFEKRVDIEYLKEGGREGNAYPLVSPSDTSGKLTLEKGRGKINPFYGEQGYKVGMRLDKVCVINVLSEDGEIKRSFSFDKGVISVWECSALEAERSSVLIDKLVIEHTGLVEINN